MREIYLDCPAKINLFLEVLGKRCDGYHEVRTVMQSVSLHDRVFLKDTGGKITVECNGSGIPTDERNLAFKAAKLIVEETGRRGGVEIRIDKKIPVGSGLGGASADAAGTLVGLNRLWDLNLQHETLIKLSRKIGTDVSFFISISNGNSSGFTGGTFLGKGRGDEMVPLAALPECWVIMVCPRLQVSTKWVYDNLRGVSGNFTKSLELTEERKDFKMIIDGLRKGDLDSVAGGFFNRLEEVVFARYSYISEIKTELLQKGSKAALMTGSGPVIFGFSRDEGSALQIAREMSRKRKENVYVIKTT